MNINTFKKVNKTLDIKGKVDQRTESELNKKEKFALSLEAHFFIFREKKMDGVLIQLIVLLEGFPQRFKTLPLLYLTF